MFSRCGGLLAFLLVLGNPAKPQEVPVLRGRIARLDRALSVARELARRADSVAHGSIPPATELVTEGLLRIQVPPRNVLEARSAASRAWMVIDSSFGTAAGLLAERTFTLVVMRGDQLPRANVSNPVLTTGTESDISQRLLWVLSTALAEQSDSTLHAWLGGAIVPEYDPTREPRAVYIALVTASSPAARRCYAGDLDGCRSLLELGATPSRITDWYDPARRRSLVQELDNLEEVRMHLDLERSCVNQGSDDDCVTLLRGVPPAALSPPVPNMARYSLVRTAVRLGGRRAYTRLLESAGRPIEERLALASAIPPDSLLGAWRLSILRARPQPVAVDPRGGWVALSWGVIFGLLALRSTRWR